MDLRTRLNSHVRQHGLGGNYFYFKLWFCDSITYEKNYVCLQLYLQLIITRTNDADISEH